MRDSKIVGAFHEPENARLDSEGLTRFRFMVPMDAEKNRKRALHEPHEPQGAAGILLAALSDLFQVQGPNGRHQSRGGFPLAAPGSVGGDACRAQ